MLWFDCDQRLAYLSDCEQRLINLFLQLPVVVQLPLLQSVQPLLLLVHGAPEEGLRVHVRKWGGAQVAVLI